MNQNVNRQYINYLNNFKYDFFSSKNIPYSKALTPSHQQPKKIFLSKEKSFLPSKSPEFLNKKTLILDLDETLVHSSYEPFPKNDIVLTVNFEGIYYKIYVLVRPGAEEFLKNISKYFELVIFTASLSKYASPLLDILDKEKNIQHRLYREKCTFLNGVYIKPLKKIGRSLKDIIIVDNSPLSYAFDSDNGLPISSFFDDKNDKELTTITPLLIFLSKVKDIRKYIRKFVHFDNINYSIAYKIIDEQDNLEKVIEKNKLNNNNNNYDNKVNDNKDNLDDIILNKNKISIDNTNKKDFVNNIFPLKTLEFSSKKDNIPIILNTNINQLKSLENKLHLYQNININNFGTIEYKHNKRSVNKDKNKINVFSRQQKNLTSNNINKGKKISQKLFLNLTQRKFKGKLVSEKNDLKTTNKKNLLLNKALTLGIAKSSKNIFVKNKTYNNNDLLISNFNIYRNNKKRSNISIFRNNKFTMKNNINTIINNKNQKTYNYNLKYSDLLNIYNNNKNLLNKKIKNKYLSFINKAFIFDNLQPKIRKRISSSITNKENINAKKKINQVIFNSKYIKSKSSSNINKYRNKQLSINKNGNKINTEI